MTTQDSFQEKIKQLQDYLKTRPDLRKKWAFPIECDASETKCHSNEQTYIEYLMDATDFISEVCKKFEDVLRLYAEDQKEKLQEFNDAVQSLVLGSFGYSQGNLALLTNEQIQKKFEGLFEK